MTDDDNITPDAGESGSSGFLTLEEVAAQLKRMGLDVALRTLRDHCSAGVLRSKKVRRTWFVDPAGVAAYRDFLAQPVPVVRGPQKERPSAEVAAGEARRRTGSADVEIREERDPDGRVVVRAEGRTVDRRFERHGAFVRFHPNGQKAAEGRYADGLADGEWREWHANGHLAAEGAFAAGEQTGVWRTFDVRGKVIDEGTYRNGRPEGRFVVYHDDGSIWREGRYENGVPVGEWRTNPHP